MGFNYVIEHMEEDEDTSRAIPRWVEMEYKHMQTLAGQDSKVHFTHLSKNSCATLSALIAEPGNTDLALGFAHHESIVELLKATNVSLDKVCLLDPKAPQELSPEDGDGRFTWFLFGGILGDDPPRDRTGELRALGFPGRHLGPVQMTTDTALGVTKLVVQDKQQLNEIKYIDHPTITFNPKESVQMPFRYIAQGDGPLLPPGMREHLHEDLNQSFEF